MRQALATTVAYETIAAEYSTAVQAAGLRLGIIDICKNDAPTPDAFRKSLTRQLQATLPTSVPRSIRADASGAPADVFAKHEQQVRAAIFEAAHASPVLRPITVRDRTGRECTEFLGEKSAWMAAYKGPMMLTKTIVGQPVRLPTIL